MLFVEAEIGEGNFLEKLRELVLTVKADLELENSQVTDIALAKRDGTLGVTLIFQG